MPAGTLTQANLTSHTAEVDPTDCWIGLKSFVFSIGFPFDYHDEWFLGGEKPEVWQDEEAGVPNWCGAGGLNTFNIFAAAPGSPAWVDGADEDGTPNMFRDHATIRYIAPFQEYTPNYCNLRATKEGNLHGDDHGRRRVRRSLGHAGEAHGGAEEEEGEEDQFEAQRNACCAVTSDGCGWAGEGSCSTTTATPTAASGHGSEESEDHEDSSSSLEDDCATMEATYRNMSLFNESLYNFVRPAPAAVQTSAGVIALDLDGTTDCDDMDPVRELVREAKRRGFAVVIITARNSPRGVDCAAMGLPNGADSLYFNAGGNDVVNVKARQLEHAHIRAGLSEAERDRSVLVDNRQENVDAVDEVGFRGVVATCGSLSGELAHILGEDERR